MEAAVAKYFNQNATEQSEPPPSPAFALRMLIDLPDQRIQGLLEQAHGSVEAAFDLHLNSVARQDVSNELHSMEQTGRRRRANGS